MDCINLSQVNDTLENEPRGGQRYSITVNEDGIGYVEHAYGAWRKHEEIEEIENALRQSDEKVLELENRIKFLEMVIANGVKKANRRSKNNR